MSTSSIPSSTDVPAVQAPPLKPPENKAPEKNRDAQSETPPPEQAENKPSSVNTSGQVVGTRVNITA
ncbi:MAG: hypothetical protein V4623_02040 [Pseudomonadota bacterium]